MFMSRLRAALARPRSSTTSTPPREAMAARRTRGRTAFTALGITALATAMFTSTAVAAPQASQTSPTSKATAQSLDWGSCGPKIDTAAQCAMFRVPLDWSDPTGQQIELAVARHPAIDQANKVGTLMFLPGAGVSAVNQVATPTTGGLGQAPELAQRFDIVGIDPRGGGLDLSGGWHDAAVHSQSLGCARPFNDPAVTRFPTDRAGYDRLVAHNRAAADSCVAGSGALVGHLDAESQARDAEALRAALGESKLSWFAWTYGSLVAQTYAHLYPDRVRAMVIDSPLDHTVPAATYLRLQARSTDEAFRRFVAWCARTPYVDPDGETGPRLAEGCALHEEDAGKALDDLIAQADREPIPVPGVDHPITGEELSFSSMYALQNGNLPATLGGWSDLAQGIYEIRRGNTAVYAPGYANTLAPPYYHPYRAVGCLDFPNRVSGYQQFQALRRDVVRLAPHTKGASDSWDYLSGCVGWPYPSTAPDHPLRVRGAAPILLVATRHSPLAPYPLARRVAHQIEDSVVLTYEGDAHIAYFNSACVREQEQRYLVSALTPPPGTSCADSS